ncbi:MAG: fumarylacetoacetate hydrolase family protein [Thermoleophilia bacterium]|nr:fumarylacetoacetate hydrolase family protein [Thermoleophilia bacterium]
MIIDTLGGVRGEAIAGSLPGMPAPSVAGLFDSEVGRQPPRSSHGSVTCMPQPLPHITSIRDFMVFEQHVKNARGRRGLEVPAEWYEGPTFYFTNCAAGVLFPDGIDVPRPSYTSRLDFELELACVIGTGGRNISVDDAEQHIAGFTIYNDWSARDVQRREMAVGLGPSKGKDFAQSLGPHLVTPEELKQLRVGRGRYACAMTCSINGTVVSAGNARDMRWDFAELIAHASQDVALEPGDVLGSGTVGTGCLLELGPDVHRWLEPGDVVAMNIAGIGTLTNRVIDAVT